MSTLPFSAQPASSQSSSGILCPPCSRAAGSLSVHAAFLLCNRALRHCSGLGECVLHVRSTRNISRGMLWFQSRHENSGKVQGRLCSFTRSLPGIDLGMWHDTAFAVLSATAIYTLLFRVILSPLGDSVLEKRFLLKFIKFAEVPRPIWVFWHCGSALPLDAKRAECEGISSLRYIWIQSPEVIWPADWTCLESHMWAKTGTLGI